MTEQVMWFARVALLNAGGWLAARGVGDAALWEALAGALVTAGAATWSWYARKRALASVPPAVAAQMKLDEVLRNTVLPGRS
jgi:hypothetical protein